MTKTISQYCMFLCISTLFSYGNKELIWIYTASELASHVINKHEAGSENCEVSPSANRYRVHFAIMKVSVQPHQKCDHVRPCESSHANLILLYCTHVPPSQLLVTRILGWTLHLAECGVTCVFAREHACACHI